MTKKKTTGRARLADRKAAVQAANQEAERRVGMREWQAAFKDALATDPMLVERTDRKNDFYFIVPFSRESKVTARILLDGSTLQLKMVSGIEQGDRISPKGVTTFITREEALDRLTALLKSDELQVKGRPTPAFRGLVWKPCKQSLSPQLPFYCFAVGKDQRGGQREVYVRVDGKIFGALEDRKSGG